MKLAYLILFIPFLFKFLLAQEATDQSVWQEGVKTTNPANYPVTSWNPIIGVCTIDIMTSIDSPSSMNNFICDAMLERTEADFSFINYDDITSPLYAGEITELDLYTLCPFDRTLVILEVNGAFLLELVERNISGYRSGLAISGGKIELDSERPNGNRLTYFQIGNYPAYPKKDYRVVTTDYLADGQAGFVQLAGIDSSKVFKTGILLRNVIKQYIEKYTPLGPSSVKLDDRWIKK